MLTEPNSTKILLVVYSVTAQKVPCTNVRWHLLVVVKVCRQEKECYH